MVNTPLAHDLLWGMTPAQLPADAPQWAIDSLAAGQPVVVRRALSEDGCVAVGVRGRFREQRLAAFMSVDSIACRVSPEALCQVESARDLPVMQALRQLRPVLDDCGWTWGVSGSVGFELASGFTAMHERSDLDLILRTPQLITRNQARKLVAYFEQAICRVDLQLQTPFGAVALREWAGNASRVLLKNAREACLVSDPWNPQEQAA
ncbi:malonate decarboxylase holo-ACP synthase [Pseudomonas fluorescens]|uniref:Phosphoribosyl-dephospho-CoA transferase n=1 Tax=Pseudomonas fluorescens (strain Pf0-1) TaxID=205922 RepID=MDCG_PSEPF|nr:MULTISPECIES: malonate decarboxylase holo-ACP synthase [Pseudomonas]Q3K5C0.1 RecName: Full=Phosphoribosyl-dephospho-CoA transferase; AltName: Full=Malonate decarboxylase holo-[acyl-carrier-protein] synthase; Short=Holo-ACP synthase [Pseudomonas fluorescens Pf0-1]ABA77034.1 putative phosphoribosyl-dephospho-CoA transferase [Pseudomonas fluorescens Pf0-1]MBY9022223.1 malonate decarboxylase holo-ACP synthase [Pseudomonas fluorescens]MBY9028216.1 malonate decarboxylase holo-ACP synthase [Pseudom